MAFEQCRTLRSKNVPIVLLGRHDEADPSMLSGLKGLSRTLRQEWPDADISTIDVSVQSSPGDIAGAVLANTQDATLVGQRLTTEALSNRSLPLPIGPSPTAGGPWLITGGGRGITAACAIELARQIKHGTMILAGRSELTAWPEGLPVYDDLKSVRRALTERAKSNGERPRPTEIDKLARGVLASQEIRNTLEVLADEGISAQYVQLDVTDGKQVRAQVTHLVNTYGPITGLVHGAGVLADRLASQKTKADMAHVFAPKVDGLLHLLDALDLAALQYCGLFSSAAAVFGNLGQCDYATANAWLNAVAQFLHDTQAQITIKSFCWGPWAGGMVDETLTTHFQDRGIPLISLRDGAEIFARHLLFGDRDAVTLLVGDRWQS
ncbi:MAG: SDR family NAD(P)-dependent oxidoreductase [Pseudomonadota bacterium]